MCRHCRADVVRCVCYEHGRVTAEQQAVREAWFAEEFAAMSEADRIARLLTAPNGEDHFAYAQNAGSR